VPQLANLPYSFEHNLRLIEVKIHLSLSPCPLRFEKEGRGEGVFSTVTSITAEVGLGRRGRASHSSLTNESTEKATSPARYAEPVLKLPRVPRVLQGKTSFQYTR